MESLPKVVLSARMVVPSISLRMVALCGLQMAQASTFSLSMAETMLEGSISMPLMSSMVRPTLLRAWTRML